MLDHVIEETPETIPTGPPCGVTAHYVATCVQGPGATT